jgi:hypothetical protein
VTWGHLLQNLGWAIGPDWILTDEMELLETGPGGRLVYMLNGLRVLPANDRLIDPGDRLLISYGSEPDATLLAERFPTVASNAPEYDESFDPAGCMGHADESFGQRMRRAFWW